MVSAFLRNSCILLLTILLSSASQSPLVSSAMKQTNKQENTVINDSVQKQEMSMATQQAAAAHAASTSSDIMIVDPKEVSKDWKLAFSMLQNKGVGNLVFHLEDGSEISQIDSIEPLPGGYLMLLTIKSLHGLQYKIVKTSEISSLTAK